VEGGREGGGREERREGGLKELECCCWDSEGGEGGEKTEGVVTEE